MARSKGWLKRQLEAGRAFPPRPKDYPKKEWVRFLRWRDEQIAEERNRRITAKPEAAARQSTRPPDKTDTHLQMDQQARRKVVENATAEGFHNLLPLYGITPGPDDLMHKNPAQAGSVQPILNQNREDAAAAARRKRIEALPPWNAKDKTPEEVAARAAEYNVNTSEMGLLPIGRPLDPSSKDKGRPVFGGDPAALRAANLDAELRIRMGINERQAADLARVNATSAKGVVLPKPRPQGAGGHHGGWPGR